MKDEFRQEERIKDQKQSQINSVSETMSALQLVFALADRQYCCKTVTV